jgi:hypothetical protein
VDGCLKARRHIIFLKNISGTQKRWKALQATQKPTTLSRKNVIRICEELLTRV